MSPHSKIQCDFFKVPKGPSRLEAWSAKVKIIEEYQEEYGFGEDVKRLFYEFLTLGSCCSLYEKNLIVIEKILQDKGIKFKVGGI